MSKFHAGDLPPPDETEQTDSGELRKKGLTVGELAALSEKGKATNLAGFAGVAAHQRTLINQMARAVGFAQRSAALQSVRAFETSGLGKRSLLSLQTAKSFAATSEAIRASLPKCEGLLGLSDLHENLRHDIARSYSGMLGVSLLSEKVQRDLAGQFGSITRLNDQVAKVVDEAAGINSQVNLKALTAGSSTP